MPTSKPSREDGSARNRADYSRLNSPLLLAFLTGGYIWTHYSIANITMMNWQSLALLAALCVIPIFLLVWLLQRPARNSPDLWGALSIAVCLFYFLFWMHYPILDLPVLRDYLFVQPPWWFYAALAAPLVAGVLFAAWLFRRVPMVGSVALLVMACSAMLMYHDRVLGNIRSVMNTPEPDPLQIEMTHKPNVYLLLSDGLPSMAYLETQDFEIPALQQLLDRHRFDVEYESFSNYQPTIPAMISMLNMEHHYNRLEHNHHEAAWLGRKIVGGENRFVHTLRQQGYRISYVHHGGYLMLLGCTADDCYPQLSPFHIVSRLMKRVIPFDRNQDSNLDKWSARDFTDTVSEDRDENLAFGQPLFQYIHVLAPLHSPLSVRDRCDETAERNAFQERLSIALGTVVTIIDDIVDHDPGAIIVLAGDHGPFLTNQCSWDGPLDTLDEYRDRAGAMLAVRWPDGISPVKTEGIPTTINAMRDVLIALSSNPDELRSTRPADDVYIRNGTRDALAVKDGEIKIPPVATE